MNPCPVCEAREGRVLGPHPDFAGHDIVRCGACTMISIDPMPSFDRLAELYPETYRKDVSEEPSEGYFSFMDRRAIAQKAFISTHLKIDDASRVLDIGCSAGSLLRSFAADTPNLDGYEPDLTMAGVARSRLPDSARVFNCLCDPATLPADTYDLISLSHVFEHVLDPANFLRGLLRATRPNGVVFIEVPNESVTEVMRQVRAPFRGKLHLSYFNLDSLGRCATRAGGTTVKMSTYGPSSRRYSLVPEEMLRKRAEPTLLVRARDRLERVLMVPRTRRWIGSIDISEYLGKENRSGGIWIRALISRARGSERATGPGRQA